MDLSSDERAVLERFRTKTHMAGGAKAGYVLRKVAIGRAFEDGADVDSAVSALVERGLLIPNEEGSFLFLTEDGVNAIGALPASADL